MSRSLKVLFIGNSFTARNDLPGLVGRLARAAGARLEHQLISAGGASLRRHWNAGEAAKAIDRRRFDYVVLQEQSTLPVKNAGRVIENVRLFDERITAAGSKTALYMTWARRHAPETQAAITDAYMDAAQETGATIIPAGVAWQSFLREHDSPVLHDRDGSHPTLAGSYLAACVAFAVLFHQSPADLRVEVDGLAPADTRRLQKVAAKVVKSTSS